MKKSLNVSINNTQKKSLSIYTAIVSLCNSILFFSWSSRKEIKWHKIYIYTFSLEILPRNDITFANERQRKRGEFFIVIWSFEDESMKFDINGIFRVFGRATTSKREREMREFLIFIKYKLEATSNETNTERIKLEKVFLALKINSIIFLISF